MRLQKFLAHAGVASRRASEKIIQDGRITVNGKRVVEPGTIIDAESDRVAIDNHPLTLSPEYHTIILHKPRGYICSTTSSQGKSVLELLPPDFPRLYPVGRLDKDSEGLLLLTNDGELANRLTHPRYHQHKTYEVTVSGNLSPGILQKLNSRMLIDDYRIHPVEVSLLRQDDNGKSRLQFILREGRNRQIRKMCARVNLRVHRLKRVAIHTLELGNLKPGHWRELSKREIDRLAEHAPPADKPR